MQIVYIVHRALQLGLLGCENTYVEEEGSRGISGGERKRLAFACEVRITTKYCLIYFHICTVC